MTAGSLFQVFASSSSSIPAAAYSARPYSLKKKTYIAYVVECINAHPVKIAPATFVLCLSNNPMTNVSTEKFHTHSPDVHLLPHE
jgi:hypothetical protein